MKKQIRINLPIPPAFIIVFLLCLGALFLQQNFAPSQKDRQAWVDFHLALILALVVICTPIIKFSWPLHPICNIYSEEVYQANMFGGYVVREVFCDQPSIGKLSVENENGHVEKSYFCQLHDPDSPVMLQQLGSKQKTPFSSSIHRFLFVGAAQEKR